MLTLADQGMLVCDALNRLPHPEDLAEGLDEGCCPDCCAPCGLLRRLRDSGQLDVVVRQAPDQFWGPNWAWWKDDGVNRDWLAACWACQNNPKCEHVA